MSRLFRYYRNWEEVIDYYNQLYNSNYTIDYFKNSDDFKELDNGKIMEIL